MPTTPPPMTASRVGISFSSRIWSESMVCSAPFQRDSRDRRAGGDHDVLGLDGVVADLDSALAAKLACAAIDGDAARLEQPFDALDQLIDDCSLPLLRNRPVESDRVGDEAELGAALGEAVQLGGLEQRLGRDAATHEARAAEPVLLDDRRLRAELSGTQGGDVAARPATEDHNIERISHSSFLYEVSRMIMEAVTFTALGASRWGRIGW